MKYKIGLASLGCAKNLVDSEVMLGLLQKADYEITPDCGEADVLIVNTCAFIESAREEAVDAIVEMGEFKKTGNCRALIVTGCMAQRYKEQLLEQLPEIDAVIGVGQFPQIVSICEKILNGKSKSQLQLVENPDYIYNEDMPRLLTTPRHSAYLKIADGCNHRCTYCVIPLVRGPLHSRSIKSIVTEANNLVSQGVREINLIAQDSTSYGQDLSHENNLPALLEELVKIKDLSWIRLLYSHPANITPQLLRLIAHEEKICPYLDLPLQHISDNILKKMGRKIMRDDTEVLIEQLRELIPDLTLRTSFIVGFPGETDEEFQELYDFVRQAQFDCMGVFTYSREEDTPAAKLKKQVPKKIKKQRQDALLKLQQLIAFEKNLSQIGQIKRVLIENVNKEEGMSLGRSQAQAPEVDGVTYVNSSDVKVGDFVNVKITEAKDYDLLGEIV